MNTHTAGEQGWKQLGTLPFAAAVFVFVNALYIFLVALGNITDYGTNFAFVQHVLSMDTTNFGQPAGKGLDPDVMWRAIDNPVLWNLGYIGVILIESIAAIVLIIAFVDFMRALFGAAGFARARRWASLGLVLIVLLFAGGFIAVGGEWFQMWRSTEWNGLDPAIRNAMLAGIGLVLLHLPSPAWDKGKSAEPASQH
ncbi:DUF2165 domain-containing protein [Leucobacter coleopterorum]|uniref:DUF2165 domain-containing protein n=1 Tax=Leucobacter coleopterorum TaxID=2714933 RepID=A0ABX6K0S7_9MICO|nr:DUF2165 domain-containing protein [Leucobacter coleopterorum]QIM18650.1 DUF2165 domain-containing protein [Leucobacter coleopterorum]